MESDEDVEIIEEPEEEPGTQPSKKKRCFSTQTKLEVIEAVRVSTVSEVGRQYGIDRAVIRRWCQKEGDLQGTGTKRKRLEGGGRKPLSSELEERLQDWIKQQRGLKLAVTRKSIKVYF